MPETVQALVVLLIAVLPGALFVCGYGRLRKDVGTTELGRRSDFGRAPLST
jgi:hypothetical protein